MKVIKFGGAAVGSAEGLANLRSIVSEAQAPLILVVSAASGVTDTLLDAAAMAARGDMAYRELLDGLGRRHFELIAGAVGRHERVTAEVDRLLNELHSILHGICLVRDLSRKTTATVVSYGERISALIVNALLAGSVLHDARRFILTRSGREGAAALDVEATRAAVEAEFEGVESSNAVHVVAGYIASNSATGEITNLGRGGSDYTASVLAADLGAESLDIWTDVDGFMTADPRVVPTAYTIPSLSYIEAMELCNFGAQVIYPPTIYPVCVRHIPIRVRNVLRPELPGSLISDTPADDSKPIRGISSIGGTALITVAGLSMVGVIGVNRRIFAALAARGVSVFMVSQGSSENSTSVGVRSEDAAEAAEVLNAEFAAEIATGAMYPMQVTPDVATVAIVGQNMKDVPGVNGKLFGTLGRSGISVIACAQGARESSISFAVRSADLRKSLNVIHDSFFLSEYKELNLFICGVGTVGGMLIEQIRAQREELMRTHRLKINVVGIASSRRAIFAREGLPLESYRELLDCGAESSPAKLCAEIVGMNLFNSVFVDCTAAAAVADTYEALLSHNISVVTANKIAASDVYERYKLLKDTALNRGVKFLYETNVGAGLPIIGTINDLRSSGDRILRIEAVLSGTLNFIFNALSADTPFSETVRLAKELGYSEPDPRIDLSGTDVVRKLVILSREAGYQAEQSHVERNLFVPAELFDGSLDEFWKRLPELDADFEARRRELDAEGKRWRFVAQFDQGRMSVGLRAVDSRHPFYGLEGSNNIVMLTTERYREYPMLIQGYGAGAAVTAAGVFANIISIGNS